MLLSKFQWNITLALTLQLSCVLSFLHRKRHSTLVNSRLSHILGTNPWFWKASLLGSPAHLGYKELPGSPNNCLFNLLPLHPEVRSWSKTTPLKCALTTGRDLYLWSTTNSLRTSSLGLFALIQLLPQRNVAGIQFNKHAAVSPVMAVAHYRDCSLRQWHWSYRRLS